MSSISCSIFELAVGVGRIAEQLSRSSPATAGRPTAALRGSRRADPAASIRVRPDRASADVVEAAREQHVRQLRDQLLEIDALELVSGVARVSVFHGGALVGTINCHSRLSNSQSAAATVGSCGVAASGVATCSCSTSSCRARCSCSSSSNDSARRALALAALLPAAAAVLAGAVAPVVAAADLLLRAQRLEHEVDGRGQLRRPGDVLPQAGSAASSRPCDARACRSSRSRAPVVSRELQRAAAVEPARRRCAHRRRGSSRSTTFSTAARIRSRGDRVGALQLAFVLELDLAGDRRQRRVDVGDARHDQRLALRQRAALGVRDDVLEHVIGRRWLTPERLSILLFAARLEGDFLDDLAHVGRHCASGRPAARRPSRPPAR